MRSTRPFSWLFLVVLAALPLVSHCGEEVRTEPPTQITARIYVARALRDQRVSLYVQSASQPKDSTTWTVISTQSYRADDVVGLTPIDIGFVPKPGTARDKQIEIVIEARDASNQALAQERALVRFVPKTQRLLELWLEPCGGQPICEPKLNCHGPTCAACVMGQCGTVRSYADDALPPLDPNVTPEVDKPRPSSGNTNVVTCATAGSGITCDDANACNGRETCAPGRTGALANGCALLSEPVSCQAGSTCDGRSGDCRSCSERSDGDADGSASTSCGGNDCNDGDPAVSPTGKEVCDGKDNDCNGMVDDALASNADCVAKAPNGVSSTCEEGVCKNGMQKVTLSFKATIGTTAFGCGTALTLGRAPGTRVTPQDFRLFVEKVALIDDKGAAIPVVFDVRAPYQTRDVALLDFSGVGCTGDPTVNTTITGTVPPGTYTGVEFVNGVPAGLPVTAPLTIEGASRPMGDGYRFVLAAVRGADAPVIDDGGVRDGGVADASTPAPSDAGTGGAIAAVYLTRRNAVTLTGFDPAKDTIAANFAEIFADNDLSVPRVCEAAADCASSYAALGVDATGAPAVTQRVFKVE